DGIRRHLGHGDLAATFWQSPQHFVRRTPRIRQERAHALDGGRHYGQAVRPAEFIALFNRFGDVVPFYLPDILKLHLASPCSCVGRGLWVAITAGATASAQGFGRPVPHPPDTALSTRHPA